MTNLSGMERVLEVMNEEISNTRVSSSARSLLTHAKQVLQKLADVDAMQHHRAKRILSAGGHVNESELQIAELAREDDIIIHAPAAQLWAAIKKEKVADILYNATQMEYKICLRQLVKTDRPFAMTFDHMGNDEKELHTVLSGIYPNAKIAIHKNDVVIGVLVQDYNDYRDKFEELRNKLGTFKDSTHAKQRNTSVLHPGGYIWNTISQETQPMHITFDCRIIINNNDNRIYNINVKNSAGANVALGDISTESKIGTDKMDIEHLKWVSENQPQKNEGKTKYFQKVKNATSFSGSRQYHNKIMEALGWKECRSTISKERCWESCL